MAKKLLVARVLTIGLLALGACTGDSDEPTPDASPDALTDGPPRDGCGASDGPVADDAANLIGPRPCGVAAE